MSDSHTKDQQPKRGLGRGLNALFDDEETGYSPALPSAPAAAPRPSGDSSGAMRMSVMIDQLYPGVYQPRHDFREEALETLCESIKQHGILQPILVRANTKEPGRYEIIAGERRWRAAQKAALHEVPVIIHTFSDEEALQVALVENLQREDLNPIDEAQGYYRLMVDFKYSQDELGNILGKSRSHVANTIRLLNLPEVVQNYVREGKLSSGHARALVTAKDSKSLAAKIIEKGLSVRQVEKLVAQQSGRVQKTKDAPGTAPDAVVQAKDADTLALEKEISHALGMNVSINTKGEGREGNVMIEFKSLDQLDDVIKRLLQTPTNRLMG